MRDAMKFLAVDLGASGGRVMVGAWDGRGFELEELHRFANGGVTVRGGVEWDVLRLWSEIQIGLRMYAAKFGGAPAGIAVDAWGVDFGLLDKAGRLVGNPTCYRDPRTNGVPAKVFAKVRRRRFLHAPGVQTMQINTLFQLAAMEGDSRLERAETLLMIPDLFAYFLCGAKSVEYTEASTTQMYRLGTGDSAGGWDNRMLRRVGIPERILPGVVQPGTVLGDVSADVLEGCGLSGKVPVIAVASHDTASAVASIPGLDEGSAFISSGTWSLMGVELDAPVTTERARELGFTNEGGCGGKTSADAEYYGAVDSAGVRAAVGEGRQEVRVGRDYCGGEGERGVPAGDSAECAGVWGGGKYAGGDSGVLQEQRADGAGDDGRVCAVLL